MLYVVTAISNPASYASRYRLYREFARRVEQSGATLLTVEAAFGNRPHEVTTASCRWNLQLRTRHELWHKENMLNLAVARLPGDWEYVAWIDADIAFARPDWVKETVEQLQHHPVVQLFSKVQTLSPNFEPIESRGSFASQFLECGAAAGRFEHGHSGYAWATRRDTFDALGGLIDYSILGGADKQMATAFVGRVKDSYDPKISPAYKHELSRWEERAVRHVRGNVGVVQGLINHYWHGRHSDRRYVQRWDILVENKFNPNVDLKRDWQGLWQLTDRSPSLRDGLVRYFRQRNEDSIEMDPVKQARHDVAK